jgi:hypothetical protein
MHLHPQKERVFLVMGMLRDLEFSLDYSIFCCVAACVLRDSSATAATGKLLLISSSQQAVPGQ